MTHVQLLASALLDSKPESLRSLSQSGTLSALIPEWQRMAGPCNIQHATHHFPLDEHTFRVVERTKASPYYQHLSPEQRLIVTWAALLHDIDKHAGSEAERGTITVDKAHPIKSATLSRQILQRLGYPTDWIETVALLIEHHQILGRLIILYGESGELPPEEIEKAVTALNFPGAIPMLRALTEGDIRGVQENDTLFTPLAEARLAEFSAMIQKNFDRSRNF